MRFCDFAKRYLPEQFTAPWTTQQESLLDAIENLVDLKGHPSDCMAPASWRKFIRVDRAIGTTTLLAAAALQLAINKRCKSILFISATQQNASCIVEGLGYSVEFSTSLAAGFGLRSWYWRRGCLQIDDAIILGRGLHCGLKGLGWRGPDGKVRRPGVVLVDLCLSESEDQSESYRLKTMKVLEQTIPSLGGPCTPASVLVASTQWKYCPAWSKPASQD